MDNLPSDIVKAKKLFSEFEKLPPKTKVQKFENKFCEAFKLLDNHIKENPHSPHLELISNIKKSNIRSLLNHLKELHLDYYEWFLIRITMDGDILNQIFIENPELKEEYETFVRIYDNDLKPILKGFFKEKGI